MLFVGNNKNENIINFFEKKVDDSLEVTAVIMTFLDEIAVIKQIKHSYLKYGH